MQEGSLGAAVTERLGCCTGWGLGGLAVMSVLGVWVVVMAERFGSGLAESPSEEISVEFRTLPSGFSWSPPPQATC